MHVHILNISTIQILHNEEQWNVYKSFHAVLGIKWEKYTVIMFKMITEKLHVFNSKVHNI